MARLDEDLSHPRVMLRPCLLLLLAEQPGHGYDLVDRLRPLGFDSDGAGPLYQILRRLDGAGLVESTWDASVAGPARRTYRLTSLGWSTLRESAEAIERLSGFLGEYRSRYQGALAAAPAEARPCATHPESDESSGSPERQGDIVAAEAEAVGEGDGRS